MAEKKYTIWEKISILTAFMGGLTALLFATTGLLAILGQSQRQDVAVATYPVSRAAATTAAAVARGLPGIDDGLSGAPLTKTTVRGWLFLGASGSHEPVAKGDAYKVPASANLRADFPRFPFYRFGDLLATVPENTTVRVVQVESNVGFANHTWALVEYELLN